MTKERKLEEARRSLLEIEERIGRFMPRTTTRDGVKHGEWRPDNSMIRREKSPRITIRK